MSHSLMSGKLLIAVFPSMLFLIGCGRSKPTLLSFYLTDRAELVAPRVESEMRARAEELSAICGVHVAVLTLHNITSTELPAFAEQVMNEAPFFESTAGLPRPKDKRERKARESLRKQWRARGILICASARPQLVFVRVGDDLAWVLDDLTLHRMLERRVYPRLMANSVRNGLLEALRGVDEELRPRAREVRKVGWGRKRVNSVVMVLRRFSFPTWRIYYWIAMDPLLNALIIALKLTSYSMWGVVCWLVMLHVVTRRDWVKAFFRRLNLLLLRWTQPLWLAGVESQAEGKRRAARMTANADVVAGWEAKSVKWGMGLPAWACLSLVGMPFWENVLTIRHHLYGWVESGLKSHEFFALQHGFLRWHKPWAPAGVGFALMFAVFWLLARVPDAILTIWIGSMSLTDAQAAGVPEAAYARDYLIVQDSTNWAYSTANSLVLVPVAVAFLPLSLGLYLLFAAIVEVPTALATFLFWRPRLRRYPLQG